MHQQHHQQQHLILQESLARRSQKLIVNGRPTKLSSKNTSPYWLHLLKILLAAPSTYYKTLADPVLAYAIVAPPQLLHHLTTTYRQLDRLEL